MRLIADNNRLCLDWDERSLRVLHVALGRGGVQVRHVVHAPLPASVTPRDPEAFGAFIRQTLSEHRIRTRRAILNIPRQDAWLNPLILPKGSPDELSAMVHIQVGKDLPYNKDQAVIDFAVTAEDGKANTCDVWVAAVRSSVIDGLNEIMTAAGLRIDRIGLRPYANLLAATADGTVQGRLLTVDVGPSMTEINVIRDGRLAYSRAASVAIPQEGLGEGTAGKPSRADGLGSAGADDISHRPTAMDSLLVEVSRTVEAYRSTDPGARIDRILLAGTAPLNEAVIAAFERRFGVTAAVFEPPKALKWRAEQGPAAPFTANLGLALAGPGDALAHFNFLHPKEPEADRRERVKRVPMVALVVALFVAAAGVVAYYPIRNRDRQIAQLQAEIASANSDKKARDELTTQLGEIQSWQSRNVVWIDLLKQMAEGVFTSNKDAFLTKLEMNGDDGKISIDVMATDPLVTGKLVDAAHSLKDKNGKRVFDAKPGEANRTNDPTYRVRDQIFIQMTALAARPDSRRR